MSTKVVQGRWGRKKVKDILADHWGSDIGAVSVAEYISRKIGVPLYAFPVSRLLIEGNRYRNSSLFSKAFTSKLPRTEQKILKEKYWQPHIKKIYDRIDSFSGKPVLHIAIHSFTPVFNGVVRQTDIGILFDPQRPFAKKYAHMLQQELQKLLPEYRVRRNYPYTGYQEGLPLYFKKYFSDRRYAGIEIEINNKHLRKDTPERRGMMNAVAQALMNIT